jgi:hypothetical protein
MDGPGISETVEGLGTHDCASLPAILFESVDLPDDRVFTGPDCFGQRQQDGRILLWLGSIGPTSIFISELPQASSVEMPIPP